MSKTVIVTGASQGIGLAIARYLADNGHNVVASARSKTPLEELQALKPTRIRIVPGDMAHYSVAQDAIKVAVTEFGGLDGLVLNHGTLAPVTRIADADVAGWKQHFDVNFFSMVAFVSAAIPLLRESKGRVVFTSSGVANRSVAAWGAYCASKAALKSFGATLAIEEQEVISINVAPGQVDTAMQVDIRNKHSSAMDRTDAEHFAGAHAQGKLLKPELPGSVMARLVLDAPKEMSGKFFRWNDAELAGFQDVKQ